MSDNDEALEKTEATEQNPEENNEEQDDKSMSDLTQDNRLAKVWDLRIRGLSPYSIARALEVSTATVYRDLKTIGQRYRDQILKMDPMSLVAENLHWLEEMERMALYEVSSSTNKVERKVNDRTGEVEEYEVADPNKGRFFSSALKAREMKIKMFMDTGIIPKDPERMFTVLGDLQEDKSDENIERKSPEEIKESIDQLLQHGRRLR